ncbi:nuclear transport factor 2 family protein [Streptomyces syringium]|uniref:nuclear transport factor 2 family protein n=1 Tax=Streptomyces syringium TaxID=76729 RepID=UPI0034565DDD
MSSSSDTELVRQVYARFSEGNMAELAQLLHPDVELHVPGTHALAGVFKGLDEVLAVLRATAAEADTLTVELQEVFTGADGQVIGVDHSRGIRQDRTLDQRVAIVFTVADGQVSQLTEFHSDHAEIARFWA